MNTKYLHSPRFLVITTVIVIAAIARLLPHWPNFTPVAAIALFGGAQLSKKSFAFVIPLAALFLSDLILGFHSFMWAVYLGFVLTVFIGMGVGKKIRLFAVAGGVITSSIVFYLLTNFAVWLGSPYYPQTFTGLMGSYAAGLPFFLNSLAGNAFFASVLFGSLYLLQQRYPQLREIAIRS